MKLFIWRALVGLWKAGNEGNLGWGRGVGWWYTCNVRVGCIFSRVSILVGVHIMGRVGVLCRGGALADSMVSEGGILHPQNIQ